MTLNGLENSSGDVKFRDRDETETVWDRDVRDRDYIPASKHHNQV